jgi:hypothetical protein
MRCWQPEIMGRLYRWQFFIRCSALWADPSVYRSTDGRLLRFDGRIRLGGGTVLAVMITSWHHPYCVFAGASALPHAQGGTCRRHVRSVFMARGGTASSLWCELASGLASQMT